MVSIIVPIHNERVGIEKTMEQLENIRENADFETEIILINDGSDDATQKILRLISENKSFRIIHHPVNLGYGAALKTGIKNSRYAIIAITDADGSYPNERITELVQIYKEGSFDMVVGARVGKDVNIPLIRKPAKWLIAKLATYLAGTKIPDLNSGLRVMKKEVVEKFIRLLPNGFSFTSTITLAMLTNEYSVQYVPINYFKRKGKSKIKPFQDTLNFIQLIVRMALYFNPLKVFVPLSMILVIFAFIALILSQLITGTIMDVTFGTILMTAVMVMVIGMLADLINKRIG